jgi:homoserine dehydrogenase
MTANADVNIAFIGYGTVARELHKLLVRHDIPFTITGVASRRIGWWANVDGLDPAAPAGTECRDVHEWLEASKADVVFEAIALEPQTGQPALDYLRAALEHGAHAISANKGPVVHGYRELTDLAARMGRKYRFESAVMDGAPVFSLVRECLPLAGLRGVRGIFTSTATIVLEAIEEGRSIADGIAHAQQLGIAEADPSYDVDGWDSAVKLCAVANVLLGGDLRPSDVERVGIRELDEEEVRRASVAGSSYRLVGEVGRDDTGRLTARVAPVQCKRGSALAVSGTTLVTHLEADMFPGGLTITSHDPDTTTTAYGMFADFLMLGGSQP